MNRRMLLLASALILGPCVYRGIHQVWYWGKGESSAFHEWMAELDRTLPKDARILLLAPEEARLNGYCHLLSTRLYPRIVYLLPPGAKTLEEARDWIVTRRLTWVIFQGADFFDGRYAYARRIGGTR